MYMMQRTRSKNPFKRAVSYEYLLRLRCFLTSAFLKRPIEAYRGQGCSTLFVVAEDTQEPARLLFGHGLGTDMPRSAATHARAMAKPAQPVDHRDDTAAVFPGQIAPPAGKGTMMRTGRAG
jgi:hypothetical protein